MRIRLDALANVAIIVVCCAATTQVVLRIRREHAIPRPPVTLKAGERLSVQGVNWALAERTAVLVISANCRYCVASMPFYRSLVARRDLERARVRFVVLASDEPAVLSRYLGTHGLNIDQTGHVAAREMRIRGTPTLLVVSGSGVVEALWAGQLDSPTQQRVQAALFPGKPRP